MYATSLGSGGTLPIHAKFFPSEQFLELKLTGLQQDVMKESMHVALTVAWNLTSEKRKQNLRELYDGKSNKYGINIHPGDVSVQKDGPSAGACITTVIYSLINNKAIPNNIAITGEINLQGKITEIGGLHLKILGAIKAGVTEIIYPEENEKDYLTFAKKHKDTTLLNNIHFYKVTNIEEVFKIVFK